MPTQGYHAKHLHLLAHGKEKELVQQITSLKCSATREKRRWQTHQETTAPVCKCSFFWWSGDLFFGHATPQ